MIGKHSRPSASTELCQMLEGVPLTSCSCPQIQRGVAYEESCKLAGKWAPIVKKNREVCTVPCV